MRALSELVVHAAAHDAWATFAPLLEGRGERAQRVAVPIERLELEAPRRRAGMRAALTRSMSNESKRAEGAAEELGGKIKKNVGKLVGNEQMEAEGKAKELKGEAKQEAAKAAERTKGKVQEVAGAVKNRLGHIIDDEEMIAEGKAKELEGEARQKAND